MIHVVVNSFYFTLKKSLIKKKLCQQKSNTTNLLPMNEEFMDIELIEILVLNDNKQTTDIYTCIFTYHNSSVTIKLCIVSDATSHLYK